MIAPNRTIARLLAADAPPSFLSGASDDYQAQAHARTRLYDDSPDTPARSSLPGSSKSGLRRESAPAAEGPQAQRILPGLGGVTILRQSRKIIGCGPLKGACSRSTQGTKPRGSGTELAVLALERR